MPATSRAAELLGRRIHHRRTDLDYSREYLAARTGQDTSTIQRAESGSTDIRVSTLVLIADALGIDPGDLVRDLSSDMVPPREPRSENRKRIGAARRGRHLGA